jgi:hypothetical protein
LKGASEYIDKSESGKHLNKMPLLTHKASDYSARSDQKGFGQNEKPFLTTANDDLLSSTPQMYQCVSILLFPPWVSNHQKYISHGVPQRMERDPVRMTCNRKSRKQQKIRTSNHLPLLEIRLAMPVLLLQVQEGTWTRS